CVTWLDARWLADQSNDWNEGDRSCGLRTFARLGEPCYQIAENVTPRELGPSGPSGAELFRRGFVEIRCAESPLHGSRAAPRPGCRRRRCSRVDQERRRKSFCPTPFQ